jgi:UPF0176 protein
MPFLNISGYKFITLKEITALHTHFLRLCAHKDLKGTILLSHEGININLAGAPDDIIVFKNAIKEDANFTDIVFKESYSSNQSFKRLKIKMKDEIITLRQPVVNTETRAPSIAPKVLKQWLDEKEDMILLDTRNDYEVRFGTFKNSKNLSLKNFTDFPSEIHQLETEKPVVMFCTGGIRCEKAALYMLSQGFKQVYQLEGGILNYFSEVGMTHYDGECFVFDERISVDADLNATATGQCTDCHGPIVPSENIKNTFTCEMCS